MSLISGFRRPAAPEWEPPARPTAGRAAAETAGAAVASLLLYVGVLRFFDPPHPGIQLGTALVAVVLFPRGGACPLSSWWRSPCSPGRLR
ncbi:hypothetical protein OG285_37670 (plasmid) [Streptomyces sp. NBC_01471]|uniref:hypothetical protein n=1 Tax=Streptomyces sp. NBC_01471 TaxID=2903879 RepID=UPI002F90A429